MTHTDESPIVIVPSEADASEDAANQESITVRPEDIQDTEPLGTVIIRPEDLPGVVYDGAVPDELIQIVLPPDELLTLERRMLDLINADRAAHQEESAGAEPLEWDDAVTAVARAHSEDMIAQNYMNHINRARLGPEDRLRRAGVWFLACGENIAGSPRMRGYAGNPLQQHVYTGYPNIELAEAGLMNSPGHRKNILERMFTHVGVGIARNQDGTFVITQNFVTRPPSAGKIVNWARSRLGK